MHRAIKRVPSIPRIHQQEVPDIAVLDPVPTAVDLFHRNDILGEIIPDAIESTKFTLHGVFRGQQISHLHIQLLILFAANKIYLFVARFAYGHLIAPAQQLQIDNVLED